MDAFYKEEASMVNLFLELKSQNTQVTAEKLISTVEVVWKNPVGSAVDFKHPTDVGHFQPRGEITLRKARKYQEDLYGVSWVSRLLVSLDS